MFEIDSNKQQALDADPGPIQQINFRANLDRAENKRIYLFLKRQKKLS